MKEKNHSKRILIIIAENNNNIFKEKRLDM